MEYLISPAGPRVEPVSGHPLVLRDTREELLRGAGARAGHRHPAAHGSKADAELLRQLLRKPADLRGRGSQLSVEV